MPASIKVPTTFTAKDDFSKSLNKMTKNLNRFTGSMTRLDTKMSKFSSGLSNISKLGIGLGVGILVREGAKAITDFEEGLVGVGKTTGIEGKKLKGLGFDILKVSKSLRGIDSIKLLEFAQVAGQMGITSSKHILKFSETMAKLEKSTDIVGEEGASNISRLLTITKEGVGVIDQFGASIVALGNSSAATESEILSVASEVGRATSAYKLQSAEILGLSAALKSLDVAPEAAGSAVQDVFLSLEKATIKGGKSLNNFSEIMKMTPKEVKETFEKSPLKAFRTFVKGLNEVSESGGSVTDSMIKVGLGNKRVLKGIVPLATNYALLNDKLNESTKAWKENKALNEEFATATKTINTGIAEIVKSFKRLIIEQSQVGSTLDYLRKILFFVSDNMGILLVILGSLAALFVSVKISVWANRAALIAYNIALWSSRAAIFAYNIVLGVSSALSSTASIAVAGNTVAIKAYRIATAITTGVQWLFAAAVNATVWPILLVVAAIVAVIAIVMNWGKITDWISEKWGKFISWFKTFDFVKFFKQAGLALINFLLLPMKTLLSLISKIPGSIGDIAGKGLDKINEMTGSVEVNDNTGKTKKPIASSEQRASESIQKTISESFLNIHIKGNTNAVEKTETNNGADLMPNLTPTF